MIHHTEILNSYEVQALVDLLMYAIPQDRRLRIMQELPVVYNKLMGETLVYVTETIGNGARAGTFSGECQQCDVDGHSPPVPFSIKAGKYLCPCCEEWLAPKEWLDKETTKDQE